MMVSAELVLIVSCSTASLVSVRWVGYGLVVQASQLVRMRVDL
jgi:hypothetical protein